MKAKEIKSAPVTRKKTAHISEKPLLERNADSPKKSHKQKSQPKPVAHAAEQHTIFGVHEHHQHEVNKLQHSDPELWHRIRSWN